MDTEALNIETKTNSAPGPGASGTSHKLTAIEFNQLVQKINELVEKSNKTVYLSQDEYDALVAGDQIDDDVEYNIIEE